MLVHESIPTDPTTTDAAWMNEALAAAGVADGASVVDVRFTGIADSRTQQVLYTRGWSTMTNASFEAPEQTGVHAAVSQAVYRPGVSTVSTTTEFTPWKDTVLGIGSRGVAVRVLQRALGGVAVDGVFDTVTRDKVLVLQRTAGLEQTGVVGGAEWDALEARHHPFTGDRATVLRPGDTGPRVAVVQRLLHVPVTGVYDEVTRQAVKAAQGRAGLASTGVIASRTWSMFDTLTA